MRVYEVGAIKAFKTDQSGGPKHIVTDPGEALPAAAGYAVGDSIWYTDEGVLLHCVDIGGTKYWRTDLCPYIQNDGLAFQTISATTSIYGYIPWLTGAAKLHVYDVSFMIKTQSGVHDGSNYVSFTAYIQQQVTSIYGNTSAGIDTTGETVAFVIDDVLTNRADGTAMDTATGFGLRTIITAVGAIPATDIDFGCYNIGFIYE